MLHVHDVKPTGSDSLFFYDLYLLTHPSTTFLLRQQLFCLVSKRVVNSVVNPTSMSMRLFQLVFMGLLSVCGAWHQGYFTDDERRTFDDMRPPPLHPRRVCYDWQKC